MKKQLIYLTLIVAFISAIPRTVHTAVMDESLIHVQDSTSTGSLVKGRRVKDAGNIDDSQQTGILPAGLMAYDNISSDWDKVQGTSEYGLEVDVTRMPSIATTPVETGLLTLLNNYSSTVTGASNDITNLTSRHSWQISNTKVTPDVSIIAKLLGSLDGSNFNSLDTFTNVTSFELRAVINAPISYLKGQITLLNYTGTAPVITVKSNSGGI